MPRPPFSDSARESARDAAPDPLVSLLHEQVTAERLLAEARHREILAKLQEQLSRFQIHFPEAKDLSLEATMKSSSVLATGEAQNDKDGAFAQNDQRMTDRAARLSQQLHEEKPDQDDSKQHLSKDSKFAFGSKWTSEGSSSEVKHMSGVARISFKIRSLVAGRRFELLVAGMITLNALVMCVEIQHAGIRIGRRLKYDADGDHSSNVWPGAESVFVAFDWIFGLLFLLEAILKLVGFHLQYFRVAWNLVDFTCVVAFVIDKITSAIDVQFLDAQTVRLMRLFRLVRLVRLIRHMEKLDMLYIMTTAIRGSTMIIVWAFVLLSLVLMTCALFLSELLQSTYFDGASYESLSPAELASRLELYKYFGSFSRCMFSMFELTLANWPPVARLLTEEISEWFSLICVLHKLVVGFAIVGVINGVILQETFKVALTDDLVMVRQRKRAKLGMQKKMQEFFEALDLDRDGALTFSEFMVVAAQPEVMLWLESLEIETDDLLTLFLLIDSDGDGTLTMDELISEVPRLRGGARGIDMLALRKNVPPFQIKQEEDEKYRFALTRALSSAKIGEITETQFSWGKSQSFT